MNQFLVCLMACVAVAWAQPPNRAEMDALKNQCKAEVGATDAEADSMRPFEVPTTRGASCMLACFEKKGGVMNADNTFNSAAAIEKMSHVKDKNLDEYNKMVTIINKCVAKVTAQTDQCDAAKAWVTCIKTERAAAGLPDFPSHPH